MGRLSVLSDELMLKLLQNLSYSSLLNLSGVSKALYCFCNHEDLWRSLTLQAGPHTIVQQHKLVEFR